MPAMIAPGPADAGHVCRCVEIGKLAERVEHHDRSPGVDLRRRLAPAHPGTRPGAKPARVEALGVARCEHEQQRRFDPAQAGKGFEHEVAFGAADATRDENLAPGSDAQALADRRLPALRRRVPTGATGMLEIARDTDPGGGKTEGLIAACVVRSAHQRQRDRFENRQ